MKGGEGMAEIILNVVRIAIDVAIIVLLVKYTRKK